MRSTREQQHKLRRIDDIQAAEREFEEKIWLARHRMLMLRVKRGEMTWQPEIRKKAEETAKRIEERYEESELGPYTDFEWGMLAGKLSALRWIMGDDWDSLDT